MKSWDDHHKEISADLSALFAKVNKAFDDWADSSIENRRKREICIRACRNEYGSDCDPFAISMGVPRQPPAFYGTNGTGGMMIIFPWQPLWATLAPRYDEFVKLYEFTEADSAAGSAEYYSWLK